MTVNAACAGWFSWFCGRLYLLLCLRRRLLVTSGESASPLRRASFPSFSAAFCATSPMTPPDAAHPPLFRPSTVPLRSATFRRGSSRWTRRGPTSANGRPRQILYIPNHRENNNVLKSNPSSPAARLHAFSRQLMQQRGFRRETNEISVCFAAFFFFFFSFPSRGLLSGGKGLIREQQRGRRAETHNAECGMRICREAALAFAHLVQMRREPLSMCRRGGKS